MTRDQLNSQTSMHKTAAVSANVIQNWLLKHQCVTKHDTKLFIQVNIFVYIWCVYRNTHVTILHIHVYILHTIDTSTFPYYINQHIYEYTYTYVCYSGITKFDEYLVSFLSCHIVIEMPYWNLEMVVNHLEE